MKKLISLLSLVLLISISFISCTKDDSSNGGKVKYVVSCSGGFDITYQNSGGNTEQKTITNNTWQTEFSGYSGQFVYISAQAGQENAIVTVSIYLDGKTFKTATSSGDYVIATASGSLP